MKPEGEFPGLICSKHSSLQVLMDTTVPRSLCLRNKITKLERGGEGEEKGEREGGKGGRRESREEGRREGERKKIHLAIKFSLEDTETLGQLWK